MANIVEPNPNNLGHNSDPQQDGRTPVPSKVPSKVTLGLVHLPSKKDLKALWPRTPTRVRQMFIITLL